MASVESTTIPGQTQAFRSPPRARNTLSSLLPLLSLPLFLASIYPSLRWYLQRSLDRSDEPLGLITLSVAAYFLFQQRAVLSIHHRTLISASLSLMVSHILRWHIPPMILATFSIITLLLALHLPRIKPGLAALLFLSLPLMASLDFYVGYPMRLAAATIAHGILNLLQFDVQLQGVMLNWHDQLIGVDPPCSGVRMLWVTLFVTSILCTSQALSWPKTARLFILAILCVVIGNSLRATILFFPESKLIHWPAWTHEGVGIAMQILILITLQKLSGFHLPNITPHSFKLALPKPLLISLALIAITLTAAAAFTTIPRTNSPSSTPSTPSPFTWPSTFNGIPLIPLPLTEREQHFLKNFPGHIARFQCGHDELILRQVTRPTRLLHSSTDCLQASGFSLKAQPLFRDADSNVWSHHQATFQGQCYHLKERIHSLTHPHQSNTDISAWYWSALLNPDHGPWLAITKLEAIP